MKKLLKKLNPFVNSPQGYKLIFLVNHDVAQYKLADNICDLTYAQIHFLMLVAKKQQEEIDKAYNGAKSNPMMVTGDESPEEIKSKIAMMKGGR